MQNHASGLPLQSAARWNCRVDEELRRDLLARRDEDQRIRNLVSALPGRHRVRLPEEAQRSGSASMRKTRGGLRKFSARGWPGRTLVGEEGAGAAWLLAQHADRDPVRQQAFLHALRSAVGQGQASRAHLAYLADRVRVNAGQPQLYGTQFTVTDGVIGPCPIEDQQRLDERRAETGLEPFADYEARMRRGLTARWPGLSWPLLARVRIQPLQLVLIDGGIGGFFERMFAPRVMRARRPSSSRITASGGLENPYRRP